MSILAEVRAMLEPYIAMLQDMALRAVVTRVDEAKLARELQLKVMADDSDDGVEHTEPYGWTSRPIEPTDAGEAEAVLLTLGGDASHTVALVVFDRRWRPTNLVEGEVAVYDDLGQFVKLARSALKLEAPSIELGDGATKGVNRQGDLVATNAAFTAWRTAVEAAVLPTVVAPLLGTAIGTTGAGSSVVKAVD